MNVFLKIVNLGSLGLLLSLGVSAQGIHFSQYYQAPQLLSPANTGLMPNNDFRIGANYRDQWSNVPVPFKTLSMHGEFQAFKGKNLMNWMGIGVSYYSDKAGAGDLSLNKINLNLAYHLALDDYSMFSVGLGVGNVTRSINFEKLTFDAQWDGYLFNRTLPQNENYLTNKVNYWDVVAGVNYAYFPDEFTYIKVGAGLQHINRPNESFYKQENKLGMRPTANFDALFLTHDNWIINPSIYVSYQKKASEIVAGSTFAYNLKGNNQLFLGAYYRVGESVIPTIGIEFDNIRIISSYDINIATYTQSYRSMSAFELSFIYQGNYKSGGRGRAGFSCPRF